MTHFSEKVDSNPNYLNKEYEKQQLYLINKSLVKENFISEDEISDRLSGKRDQRPANTSRYESLNNSICNVESTHSLLHQ